MFEYMLSLVALTGVVAVITLGLTIYHYYNNFRTCSQETSDMISLVATTDAGLADWDT